MEFNHKGFNKNKIMITDFKVINLTSPYSYYSRWDYGGMAVHKWKTREGSYRVCCNLLAHFLLKIY